MDAILDYLDDVLLDSVYSSARQAVELKLCPTRPSKDSSSLIIRATQRLHECLCSTDTNLSMWNRESLIRQSISLFFLLWQVFHILYGK